MDHLMLNGFYKQKLKLKYTTFLEFSREKKREQAKKVIKSS